MNTRNADSSPDAAARWPSLAEIFFGRLASLARARRVRQGRKRCRFQFEALESRILLSADLVGTLFLDAAIDPLLPGDRAPATVLVENLGDTAAKGSVGVSVYASADGVLDPTDFLLGTGQAGPRIDPGTSQQVAMSPLFPGALPPKGYSLLAAVDTGNAVVEGNEANNVSAGADVQVRWLFGDVPNHPATVR
jgi:hypothetical protein